MAPRRNHAIRASRLLIVTAVMVQWVAASCQTPVIPDQSIYAPLETLRTSGEAVVRVYSAPLPNLETIATHPWLLVKAADESDFERWEVWQDAGGPYGHLRRNLITPEGGVGAGGVFIVAELVGPDAAPIIDFIRTESPTYPCRNEYFFLGPNSNTYPQWVFDNTGWDVELPATGIGKDTPVNCQ